MRISLTREDMDGGLHFVHDFSSRFHFPCLLYLLTFRQDWTGCVKVRRKKRHPIYKACWSDDSFRKMHSENYFVQLIH